MQQQQLVPVPLAQAKQLLQSADIAPLGGSAKAERPDDLSLARHLPFSEARVPPDRDIELAREIATALSNAFNTTVSLEPIPICEERTSHLRHSLIVSLPSSRPWADGTVSILRRVPGLNVMAAPGSDLFSTSTFTFELDIRSFPGFEHSSEIRVFGRFRYDGWRPPPDMTDA